MSKEELMDLVEKFKVDLYYFKVMLDESTEDGFSKAESKAYLDLYGLNNKLLNAPNEQVREISLLFAENYQVFLDKNKDKLKGIINEVNDKLKTVDYESTVEEITVKVPTDYIKSNAVMGLPEGATSYTRMLQPMGMGTIIVNKYEEKEYTLDDNQIMIQANYGITGNNNKYVYRLLRVGEKKLGVARYEFDMCLTFNDDSAFEIKGIFAGPMIARELTIKGEKAKEGIELTDDQVIQESFSDADDEKYNDQLTEARKVIKYMIDNN